MKRLLIKGLVKQLEDKDVNVCRLAGYTLGAIGNKAAVKPLIKILKDRDKNMYLRYSAAVALGKVGKPAVKLLIETLQDKDSDVQKWAAGALGTIGDKRVIKPLIELLQDENNDFIRNSIAAALGKIGNQSAVKPLVKLLKNKNKNMYLRYSAAVALGQTGKPVFSILRGLLRDKDSDVRNLVTEVLGAQARFPKMALVKKVWEQEDVRGIRIETAAICARGGDRQAFDFLMTALKDKDTSIRYNAVVALEKTGSQQALRSLRNVWQKDKVKRIQVKAACVCGQMGNKEALSFIIRSLKEGDNITRLEAAEALGAIGDKSAVKPLIEALKDSYVGVRAKAITALGNIGDKSALIKATTVLKEWHKKGKETVPFSC